MNNNLFLRYATPFTTGLFLVSLISGIALFFHFGQAYFHGMHEWLSMVLIAPFILHILRNWRPFVSYFKRLPMMLALAASLVAAVVFVVPGMTGKGGGNPVSGVVQAMSAASLENVAPIFNVTPQAMKLALGERGYKVDSEQQTLAEIAKASGRDSFDLIRDVSQVGK